LENVLVLREILARIAASRMARTSRSGLAAISPRDAGREAVADPISVSCPLAPSRRTPGRDSRRNMPDLLFSSRCQAGL
jgi:hypothetical protein